MSDNEPIKVELVNQSIPEPWRTLGDYQEDQKRANVQFWIAIGSMIISLVSVVATSAVAILTIRGAA